ncbi:MAG: nucleotidyltransferase family protein [Oceanicaulis sp.]
MTRAETLERLRALRPFFQERGVSRVRVFGSHARDEAGPDSDLDLIVEFEPGRTPDLWSFVGIGLDLGDRLGVEVDLFTPDSLHPLLRRKIEDAAVEA